MKTKFLTYAIIISFLFLTSSCEEGLGADLDCDRNYGTIERSEAKVMTDEYYNMVNSLPNNTLNYIESKNGTETNKSVQLATDVHFKLDDLLCYLRTMEEEYGEDYKDMGIRAYLAIEQKNDTPNTTILFVPTHKVETESNTNAIGGYEDISGAATLNHGSAGIPPRGSIFNP